MVNRVMVQHISSIRSLLQLLRSEKIWGRMPRQ